MKLFILCCFVVLAAGCSSTGGGGGSKPPALVDEIMARQMAKNARLGLPLAPTTDEYTFETKKADGRLGSEFYYWNRDGQKVGGLCYGKLSKGPSRIVIPSNPQDGTWSITACTHECTHKDNNARYHVPAANGHPDVFRRSTPWWPYYTGPMAEGRYALMPVVYEFEDGASVCILIVLDKMVSDMSPMSTNSIKDLAESLRDEFIQEGGQ